MCEAVRLLDEDEEAAQAHQTVSLPVRSLERPVRASSAFLVVGSLASGHRDSAKLPMPDSGRRRGPAGACSLEMTSHPGLEQMICSR